MNSSSGFSPNLTRSVVDLKEIQEAVKTKQIQIEINQRRTGQPSTSSVPALANSNFSPQNIKIPVISSEGDVLQKVKLDAKDIAGSNLSKGSIIEFKQPLSSSKYGKLSQDFDIANQKLEIEEISESEAKNQIGSQKSQHYVVSTTNNLQTFNGIESYKPLVDPIIRFTIIIMMLVVTGMIIHMFFSFATA